MKRLFAVAVLLLALSGCTAAAPAPTSTPVASPSVLVPGLVPQPLPSLTADAAKAEGTRLGTTLLGLIDSTTILHVDDQSALVPAQDGKAAFYAVYLVVSIEPTINPLDTAQLIGNVMQQSGWNVVDVPQQDGVYITALGIGTGASAWFAFVGGDATVEGQSVVTFQLASPDLP